MVEEAPARSRAQAPPLSRRTPEALATPTDGGGDWGQSLLHKQPRGVRLQLGTGHCPPTSITRYRWPARALGRGQTRRINRVPAAPAPPRPAGTSPRSVLGMAVAHSRALRTALVLLVLLEVLRTPAQGQMSPQPNFRQDKVRGCLGRGELHVPTQRARQVQRGCSWGLWV